MVVNPEGLPVMDAGSPFFLGALLMRKIKDELRAALDAVGLADARIRIKRSVHLVSRAKNAAGIHAYITYRGRTIDVHNSLIDWPPADITARTLARLFKSAA